MKPKAQIYIVIILIIFAQIIVVSCKKNKLDDFECFTFGETGNKWTYEKLTIEDYGQDTLPLDTVNFEIINKNNNICQYNKSWKFSTNFYIGNIFGPIKSFSPLSIDTLVTCNSKVGDTYFIPNNNGPNHIAEQIVISTNTPLAFKNMTLECYQLKYTNTDVRYTFYINKKYGIIKYTTWTCGGGVHCDSETYRLIDSNIE